MKIAITILALVAFGHSAPQRRTVFHEHYEDIADLIIEESGDEILELFIQYWEIEEFQDSLRYLQTSAFRNLVYEMEDIPEFKAVLDYLEKHDVDIHFFVETLNSIVDSIQGTSLARHEVTGKDLTAFIKESISMFPKEKVMVLLEEKEAEDEDLKIALEGIASEEWEQLLSKLWENETFQKELEILKENGINILEIIDAAKAFMGWD